jgi:hypothetical protein
MEGWPIREVCRVYASDPRNALLMLAEEPARSMSDALVTLLALLSQSGATKGYATA